MSEDQKTTRTRPPLDHEVVAQFIRNADELQTVAGKMSNSPLDQARCMGEVAARLELSAALQMAKEEREAFVKEAMTNLTNAANNASKSVAALFQRWYKRDTK